MDIALRRLGRATVFLSLCIVVPGCAKKAPPNLHLERAYSLMESDPKAAYEELSKASNPADPEVLLAQGLALASMQKYAESERALTAARATMTDPRATLALVRVQVMTGKLSEAQQLLDSVASAVSSSLPALLLETCLALDEARARTAIPKLLAWPQNARAVAGTSAADSVTNPPSEYYLALAVLYAQLMQPAAADTAKELAKREKLASENDAFGLVTLAAKAGRRDFALLLLRKISDDADETKSKRRVAVLAHGLSDHQLVEHILKTLPGDDADLLRLQAEHQFLTRHTHAQATLRRAIASTTDASMRATLQRMLAETLLQSGDRERARAEAEASLKTQADDRGYLFLARLDLDEGKTEAAMQRLAPLLARPVVPAVARELGAMAQLRLGNPEAARALLDAALKERPGDPTAARLRVGMELDARNPAAAVRVAEDLVAASPREPTLRLLLARAVEVQSGPLAAAQSLRKGVDSEGQDPGLWLALAAAYERAKEDDQAVAVLEEGHRKLPRALPLQAALASKLAARNDGKRAALLYEELLVRGTADPVTLNNLAMLYAGELGNAVRAVELAERAYKLAPQPAVADTLGWALFRRGAPGDLARAQSLLESAAANLTTATALYHRGAVLLAAKKPEEGRALLRRALAQQSNFPEAKAARDLLGAGAK